MRTEETFDRFVSKSIPTDQLEAFFSLLTPSTGHLYNRFSRNTTIALQNKLASALIRNLFAVVWIARLMTQT